MSDDQINAAISQLCGWSADYCTDLNAMHEAEKTLTDDQREVFYPRNLGAWQSPFNVIYATSRQRAEAFLRVMGKWEEVAK